MDDELRYRILKVLEADARVSQRQLAQQLGISLGKANYCLQALMVKGLVKVRNFRRNPNKRAYTYYLTPQGLEEKTRVTFRFFRQKVAEYELLQSEIEELRQEVLGR